MNVEYWNCDELMIFINLESRQNSSVCPWICLLLLSWLLLIWFSVTGLKTLPGANTLIFNRICLKLQEKRSIWQNFFTSPKTYSRASGPHPRSFVYWDMALVVLFNIRCIELAILASSLLYASYYHVSMSLSLHLWFSKWFRRSWEFCSSDLYS